MSKIGKAKVIKALEAIVAEVGEDHTAICSYSYEGNPQCIVGYAVDRLTNIPLQDLVGSLAVDVVCNTSEPRSVAAELSKVFTPGAIKVLAVAQDVQDKSGYLVEGAPDRTWGTALREAKKALKP